MNTRTTPITLALALLLATPALAQRATDTSLAEFQRAVQLEQSQGDTKGALRVYQDLTKRLDTPFGLRARALYRSGACLEKLGQQAEARVAYGRVVKECASLTKLVAAADRALKRLTPKKRVPPANTRKVIKLAPKTQKVDLDLLQADVRQVLVRIAALGKINVTISPAVRGLVTLNVTGLAPLEAIKLITKTVGDFLAHYEPRHTHVRVMPRSQYESLLVTRVYRLKPRKPSGATVRKRTGLFRTLNDLVTSQGVPGATVELEPASQTLFVSNTLPGHEALRRVLGKELAARAPWKPSQGGVNVDLTDASIQTALKMLGAQGPGTVLVSPAVRGNITARYRNVPRDVAFRLLATSCGDYAVIDHPVATLVLPRSALETWLVLEQWKLKPGPYTFWKAGDQLLVASRPGSGHWPAHPLELALNGVVTAAGIAGATIGLEPGSHTLISNLTLPLRDQLRRALVEAGYVAPLPARTPSKASLVRLEDADIRAVFKMIARTRKVNILLAPAVRGSIRGAFRADAPVEALIRVLAHMVGDYEVVKERDTLYRVVTRAALETQLKTEKLVLKTRPVASAMNLVQRISDVATASGIAGALCAFDQASNALVVSLTPPLLRRVKQIVQASDTNVVPSQLHGRLLFAHHNPGRNGPEDVHVFMGAQDGAMPLVGTARTGSKLSSLYLQFKVDVRKKEVHVITERLGKRVERVLVSDRLTKWTAPRRRGPRRRPRRVN